MSTFANSEDLDEMQNNAAFHQGPHCMYTYKDLQLKYNVMKIMTRHTLICTMDYPKFIVPSQKEESIVVYKVCMTAL